MAQSTQKSTPSRSPVRTRQVAEAQNVYRNRKREAGCQRIQEWVPEETLTQLRSITQRTGLSRSQLLETLVAAVYLDKIDLREVTA